MVDDGGDLVSRTVSTGKMWEQDLINAITPYLSVDKEVIEVGSYIGDHTIYLSKHSKKVWAFEANKVSYAKLLFNLDVNGCKNTYPFNFIIGRGKYIPADYTKDFRNDPVNNPSGNRYIEFVHGEEAASLDELLFNEVESLAVLKVDCEGMDYGIVCSALDLIKKFKPVIAFEYNWYISKEKPEDFDTLLKPFGYKPAVRVDTWNWLCTML